MNYVFAIGTIIEEVDFNFLFDDNAISISTSSIILPNNSIINIKGYDNIADFMYSHLKINSKILVHGFISNNSIVIKNIYLL